MVLEGEDEGNTGAGEREGADELEREAALVVEGDEVADNEAVEVDEPEGTLVEEAEAVEVKEAVEVDE
jgi:hypothetical protein